MLVERDMADNSFTYCDSDEEVFWGKVTEKDIRKRALLGNCFDSPVVRSSTPRPSATKKLAGSSSQVLPDVLNDSVKHSFPANCEELPNIEEPKGSSNVENSAILNDSLNKDEDVDSDVVIIDLDGQNDSVVIISDDENLTGNDELCQNRSGNKPTVGTGEDKFCDTFSAISTEDKIEHTSRIEVENSSQSADKTTDDVLKNLNEYLGNNSTVSDLSFNSKQKLECGNLENTSSLSNEDLEFNTADTTKESNNILGVEHDLENKAIVESRNVEDTFSSEELNECREVSETEKLVESNEDAVSMESALESVAETNKRDTIDPLSVEALIQASIHLENQDVISSENKTNKDILVEKPSVELSGLSDFDCSSLNGVSDSILNISHGSSILTSPVVKPLKNHVGLHANVMYEDISCDGELLLDQVPKRVEESEDLHMSVDEPDFKQGESGLIESGTSANTSQHSFYKSCLNGSDSSYFTALDANSRHPTSSSFQSYRDNADKSIILTEETEKSSALETSFEMVMKNRQNSFTDTSLAASVGNTSGQVKTKSVSKLPVFQSTTSLLKPPKLNVKPEVLMTSNYKWAKKLPLDANKTVSAIKKQVNLKTKIPSTSSLARPTNLPKLTPVKSTSDVPCVDKLKTPTENKTPARGVISQFSRLVKSDTKTPKMKPVNKNLALSESKEEKRKSPALLNEKDRYKNIISPIRAYITRSPVVLMKKENVLDSEIHVTGSCKKSTVSHLPTRIPSTPKDAAKATKRLDFGTFCTYTRGLSKKYPTSRRTRRNRPA
ncbi:hypothetical protein J6590_030192 [Homalodisca vitripennis]|nr:hypothetical protein J6590_030192 [Homalodisca vitripennis]